MPLAVLLVAAAGLVGYRLVSGASGPEPSPPPKADSPAPTPFAAQGDAGPPKEPDSSVTLPGTGIILHEHADDPVQVQTYHVAKEDSPVYLRSPGGDDFAEAEKDHDPVVSPGGTWLALVPRNAEQNAVTIVNRDTGERFTVDTTVETPRRAESPAWSPDGLELLLTAFNYEGDERQGPAGFVIVDLGSRKATLTETGDDDETGAYRWGRDTSTVAKVLPGKKDKPQDGIRIYGMEGETVHDMDWVGTPEGHEFFSPDFKQFVTTCPRGERSICVWDSAGGERQVTIKSASKGTILGWWDNKHVIDRETSSDTHKVVVRDMKGKVKRTLAEIPEEDTDVVLRFTRR